MADFSLLVCKECEVCIKTRGVGRGGEHFQEHAYHSLRASEPGVCGMTEEYPDAPAPAVFQGGRKAEWVEARGMDVVILGKGHGLV